MTRNDRSVMSSGRSKLLKALPKALPMSLLKAQSASVKGVQTVPGPRSVTCIQTHEVFLMRGFQVSIKHIERTNLSPLNNYLLHHAIVFSLQDNSS